MGDSLREEFERDGYVVFDPGIPAETLSDAVTDSKASSTRPAEADAGRATKVGGWGAPRITALCLQGYQSDTGRVEGVPPL